jgi:hypothetical protein
MQLVGDGDGFSWSGVYGRLGDEPLVGAACLEEGVPRLDVTGDGDGLRLERGDCCASVSSL